VWRDKGKDQIGRGLAQLAPHRVARFGCGILEGWILRNGRRPLHVTSMAHRSPARNILNVGNGREWTKAGEERSKRGSTPPLAQYQRSAAGGEILRRIPLNSLAGEQ